MKVDSNTAAVVTGGASGLGAATARALAAKGAKVAIFDLQAEKGEAVAKEIGGVFCEVNVTDDASVAALSGQAMNAVPSCAACAPSERTAATPAPSMTPPAATTGTSTARTSSRTSASVPVKALLGSRVQVPRCPPASPPCATMKSMPSCCSRFASATQVALPPTRIPFAWNARMRAPGSSFR